MNYPIISHGLDSDPDDDPANAGVEDELQDLIGRAEERRADPDEEEAGVSWGGKLPAGGHSPSR